MPTIDILSPHAPLCVRDTGTVKGRGVFTLKPLKQGETVEVSPVIILYDDIDSIPENIQSVLYDWGFACGRESDNEYALALGQGSLFNHSSNACLSFEADEENMAMIFTALRPINAGEELTINYNGEEGNEWFECRGIEEV